MAGMSSDQQHPHKFHPAHQLYLGKKIHREVDIPPRKLLGRRAVSTHDSPLEHQFYIDSPRSEETLLQKYLPFNNAGADDDEDDPYASDHFRMYEFKVRKCTRSRSHDWTDCPFAHPGEKARRRDPRRFHYSGTVCPEFRRGSCLRGDNCEFAHGVFECWLHPARYRTEACKDGKNCKRKICFFAHTTKQLRILPVQCHDTPNSPNPISSLEKNTSTFHCCAACAYCHSPITTSASPTSTLINMTTLSPPLSPSRLSPPVSPSVLPTQSQSVYTYSPVSRFCGNVDLNQFGNGSLTYKDDLNQFGTGSLTYNDDQNQFGNGNLTYKDVLTELMSSFDSMNMNANQQVMGMGGNVSWVDVSNLNCEEQQQFLMSPSTPTPSGSSFFSGGTGEFYPRKSLFDEKANDNNIPGPDFGWVNDLLTDNGPGPRWG